ncbi:MAG: MFS transporter [Gemmatimonadota bacterium]|nr:MFS transporter [Gemmatimonadota bacterium]
MSQKRQGDRIQTTDVLMLSGGHAVHDTYSGFLAPLLPVFIQSMSLTKTEAGMLMVVRQAPSVFQPIIGLRADRSNLRFLVILGPAVTGIVMSLLGVAGGYSTLVALLLIAGFSSAAFHAVGPAMTGTLSGPNLGRGMGIWMLCGELGRTLGPILIVSVIGLWGILGTAYLIPVGLLASVVLLLRMRRVGAQAFSFYKALPWRSALKRMAPVMVPLSGIVFVRAFTLASLTAFLPTFLSEEGASLWLAGASLSVLEGAGIAGALIGGWVSDRLGRRRVLGFSMIVTPILLFVFLDSQGWVLFPVLVVLGFAALSTGPVVMAMVQESCPENRAFANGIYMGGGFALRGLAMLLLGMMGDAYGLRRAFEISAVLLFAGVLLVFKIPKER